MAYYAVTSLDAIEKRDLIIEILTSLHLIDVEVVNITFDGLRTNLAACGLLGASFDPKNLIPYFPHPEDNSRVYVMLDACHALKSIRNALGDKGRINDHQLGPILWEHFEELQNLRETSNYVTHKINKRHIQFDRNRMNVRLAVQTFSNSSAASMSHLKRIRIEKFQNSDATINFILNMDKTFDAMNTKKEGQGFKGALDPRNSGPVFEHFIQMDSYIRKLKFLRKPCINSLRKTGFIGILVNMTVIRHLYEEIVLTGLLPSLPTFYLSQCVLESFFSRIRSFLGANDNPTQQQFQSAIRKLLFFNEVSSSDFANCEDNLNMLTVSSVNSIKVENNLLNTAEGNKHNGDYDDEDSIAIEFIREEEYMQNDLNLLDATIAFFAGSIEINIESNWLKQLKCSECTSIFRENARISYSIVENQKTRRPCLSTFLICKITHKLSTNAWKRTILTIDQ